MKIKELFEQPRNANLICANCQGNLGITSDSPISQLYACLNCSKFEIYLSYEKTPIVKGVIISYENYEFVLIRNDYKFKIYKQPIRVWTDEPPNFWVEIPSLECEINYLEVNESFIEMLATYS